MRWVIFMLAGVVGAVAQPDPARFEAAIRRFEEADKKSPPEPGGVLFAGSSSIRMWSRLAEDFPDRRVMNRGFGGSQFSDLLAFFDRIVAPYRPRVVLVYEGDNDLNAGKQVEEVFDDWKKFVGRVKQMDPGCHICFLAVKPSPARRGELGDQQRLNRRIREFCGSAEQCSFVDVATPMLDAGGEPRAGIFLKDRLHMNDAGYAIWREVVGKALAEIDAKGP